jgi:hypothetical protein
MENSVKSKKRFVWVLSGIAIAAALLFVASHRLSATGGGQENGGGMEATPLDITLSNATRGVVFTTAAINADGTIAKCFNCVSSGTKLLATGEYQVDFNQVVTANSGYSRWVQVDTLTTGSVTNISCTTADRAGVTSAVWVECYNNMTGAPTDTSFFLFVAR